VKSKFIVMSDPVAGKEREYTEWYDRQHLGDVLKIPGFISAQRFSFVSKINDVPHWRYCALYTIDSYDPEAVVAELTRRVSSGEVYVSDGIDPHVYAAVYVPLGDEMFATP
jgi:hypothetical protein